MLCKSGEFLLAKNTPLRKTSDRDALEKIRRSIGSTFNFHASQFEDVEYLVATENQLDYDIIKSLSTYCGNLKKTQIVKLSGFSGWKEAIQHKESYSIFFGRNVECSVLLDRDYYPQDYLAPISEYLNKFEIKLTLTPGKEIENLFLAEEFLVSLMPKTEDPAILHSFLDLIYQRERETCKTKYVEFAKDFSPQNKHKTYSTVHAEISPEFDSLWNNKHKRHNLIPGKNTLAEIRVFFREQYKINLTAYYLTEKLALKQKPFVQQFITQIY